MHLVNLNQTKEERVEKYWLVRACGGTRNDATRMKDWRLSKIERRFSLTETYNPRTHKYDRDMTKGGVSNDY